MAPITIESDVEARVTQEVERLRARARDSATMSGAGKRAPHRRHLKLLVAVIFPVLLIGGAAAAWWLYQPQLTTAGTGVSSAMARATDAVTQAFNSGVGRLFGASEPTADVHAPAADSKRPRSAPHRKTTGAVVVVAVQESETAAISVESAATSATRPDEGLRTAPEISTSGKVGEAASPEPDRIYSAADRDVTAPVPLPPLLGRVTMDAQAIAGDMDVLVGRTGEVERGRLVPPDSYQERVLIFAMKNHGFSPATRNGRPVRYLVRMRTRS